MVGARKARVDLSGCLRDPSLEKAILFEALPYHYRDFEQDLHAGQLVISAFSLAKATLSVADYSDLYSDCVQFANQADESLQRAVPWRRLSRDGTTS